MKGSKLLSVYGICYLTVDGICYLLICDLRDWVSTLKTVSLDIKIKSCTLTLPKLAGASCARYTFLKMRLDIQIKINQLAKF